MFIKEITTQIRHDLFFIAKCEHCGHEHKTGGYDDDYFHRVVMPKKHCPECGKDRSGKIRETQEQHNPHV